MHLQAVNPSRFGWLFVTLLFFCLFSGKGYSGELVKLSKSGVCHNSSSAWFDRTTSYVVFDSIQACLIGGGRLPKGFHRPDPNEEPALGNLYNRDAFGKGWADVDKDCQDSRAEALIATSTTTVRFASDRRCRVVSGRWISPFTGSVIQNASDIDIDHVVPLSWAWRHGADAWPQERRERFANDPVNLWPVEASLNRSKGDRGPDKWLPPAGQCQYVSRFYRITKIYGLPLNEDESIFLLAFLDRCRQGQKHNSQ